MKLTVRRNQSLAWVALVSIAVTFVLAHEGHHALPSRGAQVDLEKGLIVLSREARDALDVHTVAIATQPLPESVLAYATLVAPWNGHALVSSRVPGRVVALHVKPGQTVEAGQLLAEIASAELDGLQLEIVGAVKDHQLAERLLAIIRESSGAVSPQTVLEAESKVLQAANAVEVNRAKWNSLALEDAQFDALVRDPTRRLASYPVRCPLAGTAIHGDLTVGQVVAAGEHLGEIVDLSKVWARIGVLEKDIQRISVGQRVDLSFSAQRGAAVSSTVQVVGIGLDPDTHLNTVWAELANPADGEPRWLPGMTGQARIVLPAPPTAQVIPSAALIDDGLAQYVLVEEARAEKQSEYRRKYVTVVRRNADGVQVHASGLYPGDRVVIQGAHELGYFFVPGSFRLAPETFKTLGLEFATVAPQTIEDVVVVEGQIDLLPAQRGAAATPLAGTIARFAVDRGAMVSAGHILAEVFSPALQELQLELIREQLRSELLDRQYQALLKAGTAIPQRKLIELESELLAVNLRRESLRNRLQQAGLTNERIDRAVAARHPVDSVPVRSPIAGQVARFDRVLGQAVKADEPLFAIHDLSRPLVLGLAFESEAAHIQIGRAVRVRVLGHADPALSGRIIRSSRVVSAEDQALRFWVALDQPPPVLARDGQLAQIVVVNGFTPPTLAVPSAALLREGARTFAFLRLPDGTFERRAVVVGPSDDRWTAIASGLNPGEMVAIRGVAGLQTAYLSIR